MWLNDKRKKTNYISIHGMNFSYFFLRASDAISANRLE